MVTGVITIVKISIHAPTRGATNMQTRYTHNWGRFQSTLPREERQVRQYGIPKSIYISIHAPTRGATGSRRTSRRAGRISIHAPTRGATGSGSRRGGKRQFQSTLPREERLVEVFCDATDIANFNPRSHERSDGLIAQSAAL